MTRATSSPANPLAAAVLDERSKRQWTQEELAERAHVSAWLVNRIELGRIPSPRKMAAVVDALDLDYDELVKQLREAS